jgi:hypothetical protein
MEVNQMNTVEEQQKKDTYDRIRDYVINNCSRMSACEIAEALGISVRIVDIFYPRASR